jgi:TetR/AcrR family transcriptional regulator, cholesterol catabolism regulator
MKNEKNVKTLQATSLLDKVLLLYRKYGIKSITMDDVARELGISKKTLYQFVKDKNELVEKTIDYDIKIHSEYFIQLKKKKLNSLDELFELYEFLNNMFRDYNTSLEYDLKKYYASAYNNLVGKLREVMLNYIVENLSRGIKEGFFRKNMKVEIIAKLVIMRIENMHVTGLFTPEEFNSKDTFNELLKYHLFAICNSNGLKYIEKKFKIKS